MLDPAERNPFRARRRDRRGRRPLANLPLHRLVPNALTLLGLCAGMTAVRMALEGRWQIAVAAVLVAMILDALDGRIARLMKATSEFGAQLDSLADFANFGVTPALIVFLWSLSEAGGLGWAIVLLFAICCALRLARFNTALLTDSPQPLAARFFVGVPAPAGAGLALLPLIVSFAWESDLPRSPLVNGIALFGVAALMASRVPTFSFKRTKIPRRQVGFVLLGVAAFAAFLVSTPWITMSVAGLAYLASIPFALLAHRRAEAMLAASAGDGDGPASDASGNASNSPQERDKK